MVWCAEIGPLDWSGSRKLCCFSSHTEDVGRRGTVMARDYMGESSSGNLILNAKMVSNPCFLFGVGLKKCRAGLELAVNNTQDKYIL